MPGVLCSLCTSLDCNFMKQRNWENKSINWTPVNFKYDFLKHIRYSGTHQVRSNGHILELTYSTIKQIINYCTFFISGYLSRPLNDLKQEDG